MNRRKLPQVLVLSSLALLLAIAQPAAAISSFDPLETGRGFWTDAREMFDDVLRAFGFGAPEDRQPRSIFANHGSILDPDGNPVPASNGASGNPNESH